MLTMCSKREYVVDSTKDIMGLSGTSGMCILGGIEQGNVAGCGWSERWPDMAKKGGRS